MGGETPQLERFELGACDPTWGSWIHDVWSLDPLNPSQTRNVAVEVMNRVNCVNQSGSLHAALTDLGNVQIAEQLIAAAQAGVVVKLLLVRPSQEVEELLTRHLPSENLRICEREGCVSSLGGQESNFILMSRTTTSDGDSEGAVLYLSAPISLSQPVSSFSHMIARYGEPEIYNNALEAWRSMNQGMRAERAISFHDTGINGDGVEAHVLQVSLDLHGADHNPREVLSHLTSCTHLGSPLPNLLLVAPRFTDEQQWIMDHITRLEGLNCSVKVLAQDVSPALAAALGNRVRLTSLSLDFSGLISVAVNDIDQIRHEEAWIATRSWWAADDSLEGGVFWQWNEALMNHYREPLNELWNRSSQP